MCIMELDSRNNGVLVHMYLKDSNVCVKNFQSFAKQKEFCYCEDFED